MEANSVSSFLDNFPVERRSTVSNAFLTAVRDGLKDPSHVVARVVLDTEGTRNDDISQMIDRHPNQAQEYAMNRVAYESLPWEERQKIKAYISNRAKQQWMESNPPSAKQVSYLRKLGYTGEINSMQEASRLIDERCRK